MFTQQLWPHMISVRGSLVIHQSQAHLQPRDLTAGPGQMIFCMLWQGKQAFGGEYASEEVARDKAIALYGEHHPDEPQPGLLSDDQDTRLVNHAAPAPVEQPCATLMPHQGGASEMPADAELQVSSCMICEWVQNGHLAVQSDLPSVKPSHQTQHPFHLRAAC